MHAWYLTVEKYGLLAVCTAGEPEAQVLDGRRDEGHDEGALAGRSGRRGTLR